MQANTLEFGKKHLIVAAAIFATTLLWATFLGMTGISANDLFTLKLHIITEKALSANTLLFLTTLPIPTAILTVLAQKMNKANLMIIATTASLIAIATAMAAFQNIQTLWITAVFYIIAVPLCIENATVKYLEFRKRATQRAAWSATGRLTSLLAVSLVALSILTVVPQHEQYLERFEDFITDFAYTATAGSQNKSVSSGAADLIAQSQAKTVQQLTENPVFEKLREKTDQDVITFIVFADETRRYIESQEYRQQLEQELKSQTGETVMEIDILELMREQFPFIAVLEKIMPLGIWLGLTQAITMAAIFSFLALIFSKTTAVAYALATEQALKRLEPGQEKTV